MLRTIALALIAFVSAAQAAEVAGVKVDDKTSVGGQTLVLNGAGLRSKMMFKVYVGGLYLPAKATDLAGVLASKPRRIQLTLLRDLSGDDLVGALVDGLKDNNSTQELAAVKAQSDQLVAIMKALGEVKAGSVVTLDYVDGDTRVGVDGQAKGTIAGEAFNNALTRVWLGAQPAQADLKKAMLGG